MKFCTKCGNELLDEAIVCMKCGCAVSGNDQRSEIGCVPLKESVNTAPKEREKIFPIFNFVFDVAAILSMVMLWISVAYSYVYVYNSSYPQGYLSLEYGCIVFAFILAVIALVFGVIGFSYALTSRLKCEKLFPQITRLIAGIGIVIAEIMFLANM